VLLKFSFCVSSLVAMPRLHMHEPPAEGTPAPSVEAEQSKTPRRKIRYTFEPLAAATPAGSFEFGPDEGGDNYPSPAALPTGTASTKPEAVPDPPAVASTKSQCGECGQTLLTKNMARHRQLHSNDFAATYPWPCLFESCSHHFRSNSALHRHTARAHTPPGNHQCTLCSKAFKARENMLEHVRDVHKKSLYVSRVCPTCQRGFTRPWRYREHMEASKCINKSGQALDFDNA